jgi:hypothetical protein
MDVRDAQSVLEDVEVIPVMEAALADAKEIQRACLASDIPVLLGRDEHCKKGCTPKVQLLAREEDVPRMANLLRERWVDLARREGTLGDTPAVAAADGEHLPCPACGHAGELDEEGACADCGIVLG